MKAVHFGGGNIGRGFIGLLLSQAGYRVEFVDVNDELVRLLQERGAYTVRLANAEAEETVVQNVTAIHGNETERVAQAIAEAEVVTTAVGAGVLKHIAGAIAKGIERRLALSEKPLHVIACENAIGASTRLKQLVFELLPEGIRERAERFVAFPDAAVDRIVPIQQHEDRLAVTVEPFYEWVVDRSAMLDGYREIPGVHYVDRLQPYIERKLFTVNTGHCTAAYHAYARGGENGYRTIQEAMGDPSVVAEVRGALGETGAVLTRQYGFDEAEHAKYIENILERFRNPFLTDEVVRVGRSPIRKLSPDERLVRPLTIARELGIETPYLIKAIAAALLFDYPEDPEAKELQQTLRELGVSEAVARYTGLAESDPLHARILDSYETLKNNNPHTKGSAAR
ncbi:mannitol-1-phosphate 5-dehydrogenase [Cohnella laeviribosi]|uniref:mannitol-1-phosphate 5-dehydrogenase n=1 Tax=Cohnella laeviribosi TaxID=380174 RepID=UPI00037ED666|nr:mannitol-1-phosphate 5-dehydrogenase [Cohnella laeviribosi]